VLQRGFAIQVEDGSCCDVDVCAGSSAISLHELKRFIPPDVTLTLASWNDGKGIEYELFESRVD
jgi:hypothetical protein